MKRNSDDWFTLRDHVRNLLRDGKRSQHEDFQTLFQVWGKERITKMAQEILKEEKNETPTD
jgi:hypothetical protein